MSRWNRPMTRYKVPPAPRSDGRTLEMVHPGLWRHLPTKRMLVKQADGWHLGWDSPQGLIWEARAYRTRLMAVRALTRTETAR